MKKTKEVVNYDILKKRIIFYDFIIEYTTQTPGIRPWDTARFLSKPHPHTLDREHALALRRSHTLAPVTFGPLGPHSRLIIQRDNFGSERTTTAQAGNASFGKSLKIGRRTE